MAIKTKCTYMLCFLDYKMHYFNKRMPKGKDYAWEKLRDVFFRICIYMSIKKPGKNSLNEVVFRIREQSIWENTKKPKKGELDGHFRVLPFFSLGV